jgi:hypothetical protein
MFGKQRIHSLSRPASSQLSATEASAPLIFWEPLDGLEDYGPSFKLNASWTGWRTALQKIPFLIFCLHLSAVNQADAVRKMGSKK